MYHIYWTEPLRPGLHHHYCKTEAERDEKIQDLHKQADKVGCMIEPDDPTKLNEEE